MTLPNSAEDYANAAMGWLVATHPWASGAYNDVVKSMRAYAAECGRKALDRASTEALTFMFATGKGIHGQTASDIASQIAEVIRLLPVETP